MPCSCLRLRSVVISLSNMISTHCAMLLFAHSETSSLEGRPAGARAARRGLQLLAQVLKHERKVQEPGLSVARLHLQGGEGVRAAGLWSGRGHGCTLPLPLLGAVRWWWCCGGGRLAHPAAGCR